MKEYAINKKNATQLLEIVNYLPLYDRYLARVVYNADWTITNEHGEPVGQQQWFDGDSIEPLEITTLDVAHALIAVGGGFASKIGEAMLVADSINLEKIRNAFEDLLEEHAVIAVIAEIRERASRAEKGEQA